VLLPTAAQFHALRTEQQEDTESFRWSFSASGASGRDDTGLTTPGGVDPSLVAG
jgi:hypothetical protein